MVLTSLIGFLAVATGAIYFNDPREADAERRVLGGIGTFLGGAAIVMLVYIGIYAATPQLWPLWLPLALTGGLIAFLAINIGRYVARSPIEIHQGLQDAIKKRNDRSASLEKKSQLPGWVTLPATSTIIALLATVAASLHIGAEPDRLIVLFLISLLACLVVNALASGVLVSYYTDISQLRLMRVLTVLLPLIAYLVVSLGIIATVWITYGARVGIGALIIGAGCLIAQAFPRCAQQQWLLNMTINGLAASNATKLLRSQNAKDTAEVARLRALHPDASV